MDVSKKDPALAGFFCASSDSTSQGWLWRNQIIRNTLKTNNK
jgi:hypothetical protein